MPVLFNTVKYDGAVKKIVNVIDTEMKHLIKMCTFAGMKA
jgi:hypothetical protein